MFLSLPAPLSKINKYILRWGLKKKQGWENKGSDQEENRLWSYLSHSQGFVTRMEDGQGEVHALS